MMANHYLKKSLLLLAFSTCCSLVMAQTPKATPISPVKKTNPEPGVTARTYYCCRQCDYTALNMRSCPVHQKELVRVGDWYCPVDGKVFSKAGTCTNDQINLVRMDMKYKTVTAKPQELKKEAPVKK